MGLYGDFKELVQLLESVKQLKTNTEKLAEIVNDIDKRVVALEKGEDVILEKAKSAAANSAAVAASKMSESVFDRLSRLEHRVEAVSEARALPRE